MKASEPVQAMKATKKEPMKAKAKPVKAQPVKAQPVKAPMKAKPAKEPTKDKKVSKAEQAKEALKKFVTAAGKPMTVKEKMAMINSNEEPM